MEERGRKRERIGGRKWKARLTEWKREEENERKHDRREERRGETEGAEGRGK